MATMSNATSAMRTKRSAGAGDNLARAGSGPGGVLRIGPGSVTSMILSAASPVPRLFPEHEHFERIRDDTWPWVRSIGRRWGRRTEFSGHQVDPVCARIEGQGAGSGR